MLNEIIALLKYERDQINHLELYAFGTDKVHFRDDFDLLEAAFQSGHNFSRSDLID